MKNEYVSLLEVMFLVNMQTQYIFYRLAGISGYPNLSEGIRWKGEDEHSCKIHRDDVGKLAGRIMYNLND